MDGTLAVRRYEQRTYRRHGTGRGGRGVPAGVQRVSIGVLDGLPGVPDELARALAEPLIDHHVHGCFTGDVDRAAFEESLNEALAGPDPGRS